jgi:hypothetical protein
VEFFQRSSYKREKKPKRSTYLIVFHKMRKIVEMWKKTY